jgi:HPt (histidine-containing phosphotransfer) domain-containing protein
MLASIVPGYLLKRADDVAKVRTAGNAGDFETIRTIGHQLKGSGGSFGFPEITRIGAELEKAGNAQDSTAALEWASALQAYVENVEIVPPKPATPAPAPMRVPTSPGDAPGSGRIEVRPSPMLAAIVPGYLQKRSDDVGLLRTHIRNHDFESVRVIGNGMRGSGGSFGFLEISRLGDVIEHAAQQRDEATLAVAATELESYLGRLTIVK